MIIRIETGNPSKRDTGKSKLILKTYDGSLLNLKIKPKYLDSNVEFSIRYYDETDSLVKAKMIFDKVAVVDFEINLFDNYIGAELFGFYEIFDEGKKKELIEKLFKNRLDGFLYHGDYDYDSDDENDILNYRDPIEVFYHNLDEYHLYQQQTQGGIYYILAKNFEIIKS